MFSLLWKNKSSTKKKKKKKREPSFTLPSRTGYTRAGSFRYSGGTAIATWAALKNSDHAKRTSVHRCHQNQNPPTASSGSSLYAAFSRLRSSKSGSSTSISSIGGGSSSGAGTLYGGASNEHLDSCTHYHSHHHHHHHYQQQHLNPGKKFVKKSKRKGKVDVCGLMNLNSRISDSINPAEVQTWLRQHKVLLLKQVNIDLLPHYLPLQ